MITLCIPTMNRPEALSACIASAMAGTMKPDRVVIVNNGEKLDIMGPTIYTPQKNMGVAASWNWLLRNATGHAIIVNDDIEFGEHTIEAMVNALGDGYEFVTSMAFVCFSLSPSCVKKVGYFDETISPEWGYFEDNDYSRRMVAKRVRGISFDTGVIHHHDDTPLDDPRYEIARTNYVKKWGGLPGFETIQAPGERIIIATPTHSGAVDVHYVASLVATLKEVPNIFPVFLPGEALVQRARNDLFKIAYESGVDAVVWIDADEAWEVKDFLALIDDPHDFVTGMVRQKSDEVRYCIKNPDVVAKTVESCGMGFCKMSRSVIEELWEKSPEYQIAKTSNRMVFDVQIIDGELHGEDIAACHKWSGKIYYREDIKINHIGIKVYS
jgi:hypothetical protein